MRSIQFTIAILLISLCGHAKLEKKIMAAAPLMIKVVYGERTSVFQIVMDKESAKLEFFNNFGQKKSIPLTKADYEFLNQKLSKISGSNQIEYCSRSYIEASGGSLRKPILGCLGSNNKVARELQETVNVLGLLL